MLRASLLIVALLAVAACRSFGLVPLECASDAACPPPRTCSAEGICVDVDVAGEGEGEGGEGEGAEGEGEGAEGEGEGAEGEGAEGEGAEGEGEGAEGEGEGAEGEGAEGEGAEGEGAEGEGAEGEGAEGEGAEGEGEGVVVNGVLADWPCDEASGTVVGDVSGRGHTGTLVVGDWGAGHTAKAILLDGTQGSFMDVPASSDFDRPANPGFTISAWVSRADSVSHDIVVASLFGGTDAAFGIELESDTVMTYWDGTQHVAESAIVFPPDEFHYVAVVVDNVVATLYFDGVAVGGGVGDVTPRTNTGLRVGGSNYGDRFNGAVNQIRVYDFALTSDEVLADMNR